VSEKNVASVGTSYELEALPRMLRVDLIWDNLGEGLQYEIQRAPKVDGAFTTLKHITPSVHLYSDFLGKADMRYFYRVRTVDPATKTYGKWSEIVSARSTEFEREGFLTEVQEASFRYFYDYAYPVSNLPREGIKAIDSWDPETMSTVSTGMYFFNLAVGVERGFIAREEGSAHVLELLRFLNEKTQRFHGAYPHWIDGETGKVRPFTETDNGADMVETSIIAQGLLFAREYFNAGNKTEQEIRNIADQLWKEIEWDKFVLNPDDDNVMVWHWSPDHGFGDLLITGFHEAEITYILGIASPSYPIAVDNYWNGWVGKNKNYFNPRSVKGLDGPIDLILNHDYGIPMFVMHYSYLGLDPRMIPLGNGTLFEEFERLTLANHDYAKLNAHKFKGYDKYWGLTASLGPDGYRAHHPIHEDNGTISPPGALASIAYLPEDVIDMMCTLYLEEGASVWGPFGFYDAFNLKRNWVAGGYIGINLGPIGPMIENYRTGTLWETFMRAPEVNAAIEKIWSHPKAK
jgi:hypothetical protein